MRSFPLFKFLLIVFVVFITVSATYVHTSRAAQAPDNTTVTDADTSGQQTNTSELPLTSEELIAAALKAGTITYEESFRQRAFALYDDPRLQPHFKSRTIDWEAGRSLFAEVDQKAESLSKGLLADLAPFRARPNDPISVFNRPPSKKLSRAPGATLAGSIRRVAASPPQSACTFPKKLAERWESRLVRGTNIRIWIQEAFKKDLNKYETMVGKVWRAFPDYFTYPLPDNGNPCDETNPDAAVDLYLVIGNTVDPRKQFCQSIPDDPECTLGRLDAGGVAWKAESTVPSKYSGYALIDIDIINDNFVLDTIAHELAHISQHAYDAFESNWLFEGTATWVAYKVMKSLQKKPGDEYTLLDQDRKGMAPVFKNLHRRLDIVPNRYGAWLFFYSASIDLGDNIVKDVWQKATRPGPDHIYAVNQAIPLDDHFPRYAVRSWNHDLVPQQWPYKTKDGTFPSDPKPNPVQKVTFGGPEIEELDQPVEPLAARYYNFTFVDTIRKVTLENLFVDIPYAHVWAIKKIGSEWKEPEDWSKDQEKVFCRDSSDENLTELVVIVSNSHKIETLPPHPVPRIIADGVGCAFLDGWAKATLHVKGETKDVTYVSSRAHLRFKPRSLPADKAARDNVAGNTEYDLLPTAVTWTASGTVNDCTISGQIIVNIPAYLNQPHDPTRPAWGYLNLVAKQNGDFHSVEVSATDPSAKGLIMTCPGDPPSVTDYYSEAGWLLHILHQPNTYDGATVVFKGTKTFDAGDPMGFLNLLPPGVELPEIARQALRQRSRSGTSRLHTWEWELRPLTVGQTAGP